MIELWGWGLTFVDAQGLFLLVVLVAQTIGVWGGGANLSLL